MNKNKNIKLFLFLIPLLAGFFSFVKISRAENSVVISAVQIKGLDSNDDFIELYNTTCTDIDLSDWKLKKKTKDSSTSSSVGTLKNIIPTKGYYLWENTSKNLSDNPDYSTKTYYLSDNYSLALFDDHEKQIDSVTWGTTLTPFIPTLLYASNPGASRVIKRGLDDKFSLMDNYAPKNSADVENDEIKKCPKEKPKIYSDKIIINELLPAPSSGNEEYIELHNSTTESADISGYILKDASKTGKYVFPSGTEIKSLDYLVVYKKDFKFALNNSGTESVTLFDPNEKIVSLAAYSGSKTTVSYNFDGDAWRWSKFLTPGKKNKFNNLPEISKKKDNKIYTNIYADFSANGHDKDNDKLKFTWDFGDGHKSYKKVTRHKFKKAGKYKVTLKVSDGSEDKIETFNIKVEKFPKSKVKLVSVSPNPKGKDSDSEFITLKNKSKKKINLKDWSVATGSKKLYNHPITEDIILKPGKTITLTRTFSKFSLNNEKAKVELRYPDGKVASKLAYDKKKEFIKEDEIYTKESGRWAWVAPKTEYKLAMVEKPIPVEVSPRVEKELIILAAAGKNFSEDENLRKIALADFSKPQGIVLGAEIFRPNFSGTSRIQNKNSYLEIIFGSLNFFANYFLNKIYIFVN